MSDSDLLKAFKAKMAAIAEANHDRFKTTVTFDGQYHICVVETAENHPFLCSSGKTFVEAHAKALQKVKAALEAWGYQDSV